MTIDEIKNNRRNIENLFGTRITSIWKKYS